ncbi:MAG: cation:proton antiporter [Firmicutes bacterium]|nr:cation:proton antiporter [Bacillota bacterium]
MNWSIPGYLLLVLGIFFTLATAIGMARFEELFIKLHLGSKCLTAGALSVLFGVMFLEAVVSGKIILLAVFLALSNPVASHALARAAYKNAEGPEGLYIDEYRGKDS